MLSGIHEAGSHQQAYSVKRSGDSSVHAAKTFTCVASQASKLTSDREHLLQHLVCFEIMFVYALPSLVYRGVVLAMLTAVDTCLTDL